MRFLTTLLICFLSFSSFAEARDWTFMVFLNGHNNLDSFGWDDINEMEQVGSTDKVTVVVQWASEKNATTKRLLITKDGSKNIVSQVIEELPRVDMGDPQELVRFVHWAKQNYPADKYFLDIWNHGGGWHYIKNFQLEPQDISWDDYSGNSISTEEMGVALSEISRILGQKLDILGMDACLMAMIEVAAEVESSVKFMASSQEVEPGAGWDYAAFLTRANASPSLDPLSLGKVLTDTYVESYSGGSQGTNEVTFSVLDLGQLNSLVQSLSLVAQDWTGISDQGARELKQVSQKTLSFDFPDYLDVGDFLKLAKKSAVKEISAVNSKSVLDAISKVVAYTKNTSYYSRASGISIWVPLYAYQLDNYKSRYQALQFNQQTSWLDVVTRLDSVR